MTEEKKGKRPQSTRQKKKPKKREKHPSLNDSSKKKRTKCDKKKKKTHFFKKLLNVQRTKGHDPHCGDMMEELMRALSRKLAPDVVQLILDDVELTGRQVGMLRKLHRKFAGSFND